MNMQRCKTYRGLHFYANNYYYTNNTIRSHAHDSVLLYDKASKFSMYNFLFSHPILGYINTSRKLVGKKLNSLMYLAHSYKYNNSLKSMFDDERF